MLGETQFDLRFSVFGIPVRVHPAFWIMGAVMGFSPEWAEALGINVLGTIMLWWLVIFVSILIHELGHAWMAEYFGWPSNILLYHFGGLAYYSPTRGQSPQRGIAIALAGPGAGFVLYGIVRVFEYFAIRNGWFSGMRIPFYLIIQLQYVNLGWGLMNLLPILPLDGGRVCENVLDLNGVRNRSELIHKISIVTGVVIACLFLLPIRPDLIVNVFGETLGMELLRYGVGTQQNRYVGFLFGFLAVNNFQSMQRQGGR